MSARYHAYIHVQLGKNMNQTSSSETRTDKYMYSIVVSTQQQYSCEYSILLFFFFRNSEYKAPCELLLGVPKVWWLVVVL